MSVVVTHNLRLISHKSLLHMPEEVEDSPAPSINLINQHLIKLAFTDVLCLEA